MKADFHLIQFHTWNTTTSNEPIFLFKFLEYKVIYKLIYQLTPTKLNILYK